MERTGTNHVFHKQGEEENAHYINNSINTSGLHFWMIFYNTFPLYLIASYNCICTCISYKLVFVLTVLISLLY